MNKRMNSIVLTAMMVIFAFVAFSMTVSADPGVINVPSPGNETIQQAINNATVGDMILVDATAYTATETVDVNRSDIIIRSVNGRAEVKAGGASDHVFNITDQTNVTLEGFTIRDARGTGQDVAGIWMNNASDCNISNNIVTNISTTGTYDAFGIWMDAENATFNDTSIRDVYGNDSAWGIKMLVAGNANFDPTVIENVTAVNGDAYGIDMSVAGNATFNDTSIRDVFGYNSAGGIMMEVKGNANFDPTVIENVTAVNGGAFGIMMKAINATFNDTSIRDVYGNDSAWGIRMQAINANFDPTIIKNVTAVNGDAYGIGMDAINATFNDTSIRDVYGNDSAWGIKMLVAGNANFDPTVIENVTAVNGDAYGIDMSVAGNATFNDTSIRDVFGYNSAGGIRMEVKGNANFDPTVIENVTAVNGGAFGIMMKAINATFNDTSIRDVYGNDSAWGIRMQAINANFDPTIIKNVTAVNGDAYGIDMSVAGNATFNDTSIRDVFGYNSAGGIRMEVKGNANFDPTVIENVTAVNGGAFGIMMKAINATFNDTSIRDVYGNDSAWGIRMQAINANFDPTIIKNVTAVNGDAYGIEMDAINATFNDTSIRDVYGNDRAWGIKMLVTGNANFDPTVIENVTAVNGDAYGIDMSVAGNATFNDTSIRDVYGNDSAHGIWMYVINAVISHGEIKDNGHGIWIESSENTMITGFVIINNTEMDTGVHLTGDTNNTKIHGNCFIDNVPQAWDNGTNNNWTGNYWSDYIPPGPYLINGTANSEDSNPLPDCPLGQPDLNITDKSEDWVNATHYNVIYTVCNIGDAPAGKSNTTITIDGVDVLEDSVPALGVGACYTNTVGPFECTAPSDTIKVCADNDDDVAESNEMNNCMENVLECPAPARVPALTPPGIVLMIGLLAVAGSAVLRRRE